MSQYWGTGRLGTHQSVGFTTAAGTIANAIGNGVQNARIVVTSAAYVKVGVAPTATTSDVYMAADSPEYVTIKTGEKVSAIRVSADGTLHVTEIP
jgi:hypothetical protein